MLDENVDPGGRVNVPSITRARSMITLWKSLEWVSQPRWEREGERESVMVVGGGGQGAGQTGFLHLTITFLLHQDIADFTNFLLTTYYKDFLFLLYLSQKNSHSETCLVVILGSHQKCSKIINYKLSKHLKKFKWF